jgi:tetratricopeptide (TPR) repeat protein
MTEKHLIVLIVISAFILLWNYDLIKSKTLFRLLGEVFEFFSNPITSFKDILRLIAQYILSETFNKTVDYYFEEAESVGYKEILIFLLGILCLMIFQAISISNMLIFLEFLVPFLIYAKRFKKTIALLLCISFLNIVLKISAATIAIITFMLFFILKIFVIKRTQSFLKHAKELEFAALKLYKENHLLDSFAQYYIALNIYKSPIMIKKAKFDINRAKVLKNITFILYQENQLDKALLYCDEALEIYEELEIAENSALMKDQVNLLKMSAKIFNKLGKRKKAFECYKLIYDLTGISVKPKHF